jgi:Fe-S cluster assembly protein SufD
MDKISQENTDLKLKLTEDFNRFEASLNGHSKEKIHNIRRDAIAFINENGFPTKKFEEWKYTNPANILRHRFDQAITQPAEDVSESLLKEWVTDDEANTLVFINGKYNSGLSRIITKSEGFYAGSFAEAYTSYRELIDQHFAKLARIEKGAFIAMNTAFAFDGSFVFVPDNAEIPETIRIFNIADSRHGSYMAHPRNLFIVGTNARARISEEFYTLGDNPVLTNMVTEIYCGRGSMLEHYKVQNDGSNAYHVGSTNVKQDTDSHYANTTITWGGNIIRNNLQAEYAGTNTECHFYGLYLLSGKQHVDNHTLADHAMPHCYSNELYKGILADKSTGVFNGRILVREDAQKTNAYQSNNCILLSEDAMNYSKPQLEIFADDVKCSHGATTGQLSDEEMFYLRSRGISEDLARTILLQAFAGDVIDSVKDDHLRAKLEQKLMDILKPTN